MREYTITYPVFLNVIGELMDIELHGRTGDTLHREDFVESARRIFDKLCETVPLNYLEAEKRYLSSTGG